MSASQIAQILLRLFALSWMFRGAAQGAGMIFASKNMENVSFKLLGPSLITILVAVILWKAAPMLALRIDGGQSHGVLLPAISFDQLLTAMFVGLGLFFCLSSFGDTLNGFHALVVEQSNPKAFPKQTNYAFYNFTKQALTFATGGYLVLSARHWAAKMAGSSGNPDSGR